MSAPIFNNNDQISQNDPWSSFAVSSPREYILSFAQSKDRNNFEMYKRQMDNARENTWKAYASKQKTFMQWCEWKNSIQPVFGNVYDLNPDRFNLFVEEVIETRKRISQDGDIVPVKPATKLAYVDGLLHLWRLQISIESGGRPSENPKDQPCVVTYKQTLSRNLAEFKAANHVDRVEGTVLELRASLEKFKEKSLQYIRAQDSTEIKWHFAYLCSWNGLLRGESVRALQFADIVYVQDNNINGQSSDIIALLQSKGKVNHDGRTDIYSFLRHKDWSLCVHGALARLIFDRFAICKNQWPSFQNRSDWFGHHVVCDYSRPTTRLSYCGHYKAVKRANAAVGEDHARAKTHEGRRGGAQIADMYGASTDTIRRQGHWNRSPMVSRYMDPICREGIKALAGFTKHETYYMPRGIIEPPTVLLNMLWPEIDEWKSKAERNEVRQASSSLKYFLEAMLHLKKVFLQDSVLMKRQFPDHYFFKHELFRTEEWHQFEAQLNNAMSHDEMPVNINLRTLVPEMVAAIQDVNQMFVQSLNELKRNMITVDDIKIGVGEALAKAAENLLSTDRPTATLNESRIQSTREATVTNSDAVDMVMDIPNYKMLRSLRNVVGAWNEWDTGIGGHPAVKNLEANYGATWRSKGSERTYFCKRKVLIDYIIRKASEENIPEIEVAERLDADRLSMGLKLHGFVEHIKTLSE